MNSLDPAFLIDGPIDESLPDRVRTKIWKWITSTWFTDLVALYGGDIAPDRDLNQTLEYLEQFSDRWDFRRMARERGAPTDDQVRQGQGSARWLSTATGLTNDMDARVVEDATHLGLVHGQTPSQARYDYIVPLGGARLSCLLRPVLAAEILQARIQTDTIVLLGAARPVADSERDATDTYATGAVDEFDLIVAGAQRALGFDGSVYSEERDDDPTNRNLSWVARRYGTSLNTQQLKILAFSAPSSDPQRRRANSADTILFFLDHEKVLPGSRVLLITSQIYVPYVQLEALRTVAIPRQTLVETIGVSADRTPALQGLTSPNHYLQEVRSTIQAARRFCDAYRG
jgi:hypothetical protein